MAAADQAVPSIKAMKEFSCSHLQM